MTSNALMRAHQLISRAYELPRAARDGFLARESADDPALRQELAWMVAALRTQRGGDDDFLEGAPSFGPMPAQLHAGGDREYRLVRPLGEGGMGAVWLAERSDGEFTQPVALKTLNVTAAMLPDLVARFADERRILASLAHPNIAHLIDGGTTADGRPYLAIEYVEGEHIDQYCRARSLALRERVALFLKVCAAVNHAHQHLVIHRDIKPSNILVTAEGEPKLLDFGIARLVDDASAARTATGLRFMTIAYASPEQVRGDVLGTATDVYSLGMVLYELLAGARPWTDDLTQPQLVRAICDDEPVAPSAMHARTTRRRGEIPRDLDAIVLKALRKHPADRYPSVQSLADDLKRFLAMQPVSARRGHAAYRTGKWLARHRVALAWSAVLFVVLAWFLVSREVSLRAIAHEAERAEQVGSLFREAFATTSYEDQRQPDTAIDLLDAVARKATAADMAPDVLADALESVATAYLNYRQQDRAAPLLHGAWALRHQIGDTDGDVRVARKLATCLVDQGQVELAEQWFRRAIAQAAANHGEGSREHAEEEMHFAQLLTGWTHGREAEFRAIVARANAAFPDPTDAHPYAVMARKMAADIAMSAGRYDDAVAAYRALKDLTGLSARRRQMFGLALADALIRAGRPAPALAELADVDARQVALIGPRHPERLSVLDSMVTAMRLSGDVARLGPTVAAMRDVLAGHDINAQASVWHRREIVLAMLDIDGTAAETTAMGDEARDLSRREQMPDIAHVVAAIAWLPTRPPDTPADVLAGEASALLAAAARFADDRVIAREIADADWVAADAFNRAGRFDDTLARSGALTTALQVPWPADEITLLRAEATYRRDGDVAPMRAALAAISARTPPMRCVPAFRLALRIDARAPGAVDAPSRRALAAACAMLPEAASFRPRARRPAGATDGRAGEPAA